MDRKSRTHQRLLEAMVETASSRGYRACSVEQVISRSGTARSTFYEHFRDRDECFRAAMRGISADLQAEVETACSGSSDPLEATASGLISFAAEHQARARFLFVESLGAGPRPLRIRAELQQGLAATIERTLEERADAQTVGLPVSTFVAGLFRLLAIRLEGKGPPIDPDLTDGLCGWLRSYLLASDSSPAFIASRAVHLKGLAAGQVPGIEALDSLRRRTLSRHSAVEIERFQRLRAMAGVVTGTYERSYSELTVADVTAAAGISRKTFYELFRDRSHAATEANQRFFQAAMTAVAGEFFAAPSWPERVWSGGLALLSFLALHSKDAYLAFVETHAIGAEAVELTYDRLGAFTLFLEEGYGYRPEAGQLSRVCSEALKATMFELIFEELYERRSAEQLLGRLPLLVYTILAPFMGPPDAQQFVAAKLAKPDHPSVSPA